MPEPGFPTPWLCLQSLSRSFKERSPVLPNGDDTQQSLHHARSKSTSSTEPSSGNWRGRQLVFLGSSGGPLLSMNTGDVQSIESMMRRASIDPEGEVSGPPPAHEGCPPLGFGAFNPVLRWRCGESKERKLS